jgi:class 3 adenylate cyclase
LATRIEGAVNVRRCSRCGWRNPPDASFCIACGERLTAGAPRRQSRKNVTVVFCDLVGSTELGDRLDAEALRWVIARYYRLMRSVIERHGGTVEKFVGDAVMAAFGVPMLHEDDPLRGCAAAIAMRDGLAALNEELDAIHGVTLECRIGVNTGEVLAGDVATGQAFVTGDTVNIAARLEQNAAPGEILIGKATVGLAGSRLETEPVDPLEVKGKRLPLEAWRLVGVRHDADHVHEQSPLVGREQELERLGVVLDETIRRRAARVVTLLGEPGIGKTRPTERGSRTVDASPTGTPPPSFR